MSSEIAIRARGLSKRYAIFRRPEERLRQLLWRRGRGKNAFWALRNVDLEIRRGETFGIVGRNGAGKSTLLQIITGTVQESAGQIEVNGRIAALLALGAGFNPDFSGRENVLLNGAILGLSRSEIEARFDDVAAFADIGEFMDQPVRSYSSGMYARLAFSVAIHVDPDVLVVDEVLAVGDEAFRRKCFARIEEIKRGGGTILFVSHASGTVVELCDRAMLLDAGEHLLTADPKRVVNAYQRLLYAPASHSAKVREEILREAAEGPPADASVDSTPKRPADEAHFDPGLLPASTLSYDTHGARILRPRITDLEGRPVNCLVANARYCVGFDVHFEKDCYDVHFHTLIKTVTGLELGGGTFPPGATPGVDRRAGSTLTAAFEFRCNLNHGTYFLNCGVTGNGDEQLHRVVDALAIRVLPDGGRLAFGHVHFDFAARSAEAAEPG